MEITRESHLTSAIQCGLALYITLKTNLLMVRVGFRVEGFSLQGSRFLGFRVWELEVRVSGLGLGCNGERRRRA